MRKLCTLLTTALFISLMAGCGDDEPATTPPDDVDAGADVERDLERDVPSADEPDVVPPDVAPDVVEEPDAPPQPEAVCDDDIDNDGDELTDCEDPDCADVCELVCNDLLDNDSDTLIDCRDPDCTDDENCEERCQNGEDDDADGDVDCADSECASTTRCTEDPVSPDAYTFEEMGYFWRLQYPPEGVDCCFNFDDDAAEDNALLDLLNIIAVTIDYDAQGNMDFVVNGGDVAVLLEWRSFPDPFGDGGAVDFNIYRGVPISPPPPPPPVPATNPWEDGNGVFQVTRDSFDDRGPRIRFEDNGLGGEAVGTQGCGDPAIPPDPPPSDCRLLEGGPHFLDLTIPIEELGLDLTMTVFQARIEMILDEVGEGAARRLETVPQDELGVDGPVEVGGGKLGGWVRADDLMGFFNEGAALCGCAAGGNVGPLFAFGEFPDPLRYEISCNWTPLKEGDLGYECDVEAGDSPLCPWLWLLCGVMESDILPPQFDVDSNKNGVNDAISVGMFFDLTSATLDDPPVEPAE